MESYTGEIINYNTNSDVNLKKNPEKSEIRKKTDSDKNDRKQILY